MLEGAGQIWDVRGPGRNHAERRVRSGAEFSEHTAYTEEDKVRVYLRTVEGVSTTDTSFVHIKRCKEHASSGRLL